MKKIFFKVIIVFLLLTLILANYNYAADTDKSVGNIIEGADDFINKANTENTIAQDAAQKAIDLLYNIFLSIIQ